MKVHIIGIGGIGTSGLASLLQRQGHTITGSDSTASIITDKLQKDGITVFTDDASTSNLPKGTERVIYSLAIPEGNPELLEAKKKKIPTYSYPEAVGELTRMMHTICISGTHGKSTITSMVSKVLIENNFDPSVIVGTTLPELKDRNFRLGRSKLFVLESCEYKRAFLNYFPQIILLNTLEPDHLDYYKNTKDYISAFHSFVDLLPLDGYFFANIDDVGVYEVLTYLRKKKFPTYNIFTYSAKDSSSTFYLKESNVFKDGKVVGELNLSIPGAHNRLNALGAFSISSTLGIASHAALKSLNIYTGSSRRFEIRGTVDKTTVVDDYGHHPTEIRATLQAAREKFKKGGICVVFQPHQYNRTKNLLNEFAKSFNDADTVIIPNIYAVRDTKEDMDSVSAQELVSAIKLHHLHGDVIFGDGIENTYEYLKKHHKKYSAIITMGAGDITELSHRILAEQRLPPRG